MLHKKPGTYVLNVRMDIKKFATIVGAYRKRGFTNQSVSTYARLALEDFADTLIAQNIGEEFSSVIDADDFLAACGLKKQSKSVRASAALLSEVGLELSSNLSSPEGTEMLADGELTPDDVLSALLGKKPK